jgi:alkylation response protein AidB-like acyl-CoA dehydrogenase
MDFDFSPAQTARRNEIREFLDAELPENWVGIWHRDHGPEISNAVTRKMAKRGWLTYHWPSAYGGRGGSSWDQVVIQEELFAYHEPRGGQYMGVNWIGPALMRYGTDEQKDKYLPEIAEGRIQWAQLFSEPDAGSDVAALRTQAVLDEEAGEFTVNGEKIWTSYANLAASGFLLARTDQSARSHQGISALLIDMDTPGIEVREIPSSVGHHRFHSVVFRDVKVPAEALLGPLHGGWSVAMSALPYERAGNARYARVTRIMGFLEASAEVSKKDRDEIAGALAAGRMAELLSYVVVGMKERGEPPSWEASAAFAANAEYETRAADLMERVLGFSAFVSVEGEHSLYQGEMESLVSRQAPTVKIQAGTYEIQLSIIAQYGLGLPRGR